MRRIISILLAVAMMTPALASIAEASIGAWLAPAPGQIVPSGRVEVAVGFNTGSDTTVTKLDLFVDGKFEVRRVLDQPSTRGVCSFIWDTTYVSPGSHDLVVKIYSGDDVIATVSGTGTVGNSGAYRGIDTEPPVVYFANIRSGDILRGKKTIKISAYDDSGKPPLVSFLVDNELKLLKNTAPYEYTLNTTAYANGSHQLETYAYDSAGNKSDPAVVNVTFRNTSTKPIVAELSVDHSPKPAASEARVEEPGAVTAPAYEPALKSDSAARASEPNEHSHVTWSHPMRFARAPEPHTSPAAKSHAFSAPHACRVRNVRIARVFHLQDSEFGGRSIARSAAPLDFDRPVASSTRNVCVSALPRIHHAAFYCSPGRSGIPCPPLMSRSRRAKKERVILPRFGRVKARELFAKLGGILLWDPQDHSVTALVGKMKIRMKIGSRDVWVNGALMHVEQAPELIGGRTVIDIRLYRHARALAARLRSI